MNSFTKARRVGLLLVVLVSPAWADSVVNLTNDFLLVWGGTELTASLAAPGHTINIDKTSFANWFSMPGACIAEQGCPLSQIKQNFQSDSSLIGFPGTGTALVDGKLVSMTGHATWFVSSFTMTPYNPLTGFFGVFGYATAKGFLKDKTDGIRFVLPNDMNYEYNVTFQGPVYNSSDRFQVDSLTISSVPEPGGLSLLLATVVGLGLIIVGGMRYVVLPPRNFNEKSVV